MSAITDAWSPPTETATASPTTHLSVLRPSRPPRRSTPREHDPQSRRRPKPLVRVRDTAGLGRLSTGRWVARCDLSQWECRSGGVE